MNQLSENVKQQFIAQYFGQKILCVSDGATVCQQIDGHFIDRFSKSGYLLLRKVEQLTDEELDLISGLYIGDKDFKMLSKSDKIDYREEIKPALNNCIETGLMRNEVFQLLLRLGILLPFTFLQDGKPQTLTTEQIVEMGWVMIKE